MSANPHNKIASLQPFLSELLEDRGGNTSVLPTKENGGCRPCAERAHWRVDQCF